MKILSIETSCDDTAISIMEAKGGTTNASFKILANNSNSQIKIHVPYGGVYPVLAKREHAKNLPILLKASLKQARLKQTSTNSAIAKNVDVKSPVDAIAVTYGPGLEMCLWEGIIFAKKLAEKWKVPLIPTNHMEGHIVSVFGKNKGEFAIPKIKFPILSLLVSGGHTQLVLTKKPARLNPARQNRSGGSRSGGWMSYEIIGETVDDAVGEAFDKVARMLDLPYPGGPQISKLAESKRKVRSDFSYTLPRPMLYSKDFNFSFAGLKTAVLYLIRKIGKLDEEIKAQIALEFENAAIECLVYKTKKAIEKYKIKTLIVSGGVAANKYLRKQMQKIVRQGLTIKKIKLYFPTKELSGDNSLMIGMAGYLNYIKNKNLPAGRQGKFPPKQESIKAAGNLRL